MNDKADAHGSHRSSKVEVNIHLILVSEVPCKIHEHAISAEFKQCLLLSLLIALDLLLDRILHVW